MPRCLNKCRLRLWISIKSQGENYQKKLRTICNLTSYSFLCWQDEDIISTTVNATSSSHNSTAGETKIISTTAISSAGVSSPENDENRPPAANFVPETPAQALAGKGRRLLGSEEDFFVPGSQSSPLPGVGRIKHDVVFKVIIYYSVQLL